MSDDECEFEFEEEVDQGGDDDAGDEEPDAEIENKYYTAKSDLESESLSAALSGLGEVLELDEASKTKWTFKALKQLVKCLFKLKRFDEMKRRYAELVQYQWPGMTRNHTEKAITKVLDFATASSPDVLRGIYQITLDSISDLKAQEKLWFNIKLRLAGLHYDAREFDELRRVATDLKAWCRNPVGDGAGAGAGAGAAATYDEKKGTQLLQVYSLEIQMYTDLGENKTLKKLYLEATSVDGAIPPPKISGIIRECGGKMFMRQGQWKEAYNAFFQAFKHYDEAGHPKRTLCLKYLVLANMLDTDTNINPFDSPEAKSYKNDQEIQAMTELIDAYSHNDIKRFERVLRMNQRTITGDPFIKTYLDPLLRTIRTQVLLERTKPYTRIRLSFISQELNISEEEAEELLVGLVLDQRLVGFIDQVNGLVHIGNASAGQSRYRALQQWSSQVRNIHAALSARVN